MQLRINNAIMHFFCFLGIIKSALFSPVLVGWAGDIIIGPHYSGWHYYCYNYYQKKLNQKGGYLYG